ncbi:MAG: NADH-quinone oxidoreductase subunit A [Candidatus Omnitrophica bacterium]|nr:NADH-quinone oxidoreductase subunit A [Candidatus Omnitrophota bacterium]
MYKWVLSPPVVFLIVLIFSFLLSYLFSIFSFKGAKKTEGKGEPYACGEEDYDHMAQPDYSLFFPFAFFFTIAHVSVLMLTTVPIESIKILVMALIYITAVLVGLAIFLRR